MKQRGFTLLEVLIAFAITATVCTAVFGAVGTALQLHARAERITRASLLADSVMAEVAAVGAAAARSGSAQGCAWRSESAPWPLPEGLRLPQGVALTQWRVEVTCGDDSQPTAGLTTLHQQATS